VAGPPKPIDLDPLTIAELEALATRVGQEIARKRAAGRAWLLEHGTRIVDADTPKYQNPNNAAQTWSGKGHQPHWVTEALAQGKTLDSLLTDDIRPVPRSGGGGSKARRSEQ
jgi:DNA-binding protein H-NS